MAVRASDTARVYRGEDAKERRSKRRARLLEAGLDLLGSAGWQATTVTAVCERARLTPRYFYESFANRDELVVAIFDSVIEEITADVLASEPTDAVELLRATATAFVKMARDDPRKGLAGFVEALGNEALTRRRIRGMHWFGKQLAARARKGRRLTTGEARQLQTASLIVSGGLIEMITAWLDGELESSPEQMIDNYTRVSAAALSAALAG
jgi:AcrR family transcriptional regulator